MLLNTLNCEAFLERLIYDEDEGDDEDELKNHSSVFELFKDVEPKIDRALKLKAGAEIGQERGVREFLLRIKEVILILKSSKMEYVYDVFTSSYSINHLLDSYKELITVVAGMDLNEGWKSKKRAHEIHKTQKEQNEELLSIAENHAVLPFFPIDPARAEYAEDGENLYDNFIDAFKNSKRSFFGVKVYPALGYHPNDHRLDPIFKVCSKKNIPILTHCGGTIVSTFDRPTVYDDKWHYEVSGKRKAWAEHLNSPLRWEKVLERYPNLRINFAHFGGANKWKPFRFNRAKKNDILDFMNDYKNVYADFSFNLGSKTATNRFARMLSNNQLVKERSLFGTDFWVILPTSNLNRRQKEFYQKSKKHFDELAIHNVKRFLSLTE